MEKLWQKNSGIKCQLVGLTKTNKEANVNSQALFKLGYIDYRNARAKYLEAFWNLVNWQFVKQKLK